MACLLVGHRNHSLMPDILRYCQHIVCFELLMRYVLLLVEMNCRSWYFLFLSKECFRQMFQNCTSLKTVPQGFLPATTLAESCYRGMFENTAIERAPDLLVETLNANLWYQTMFNKCKSLNCVKCLATNAGDNNGETYTQNWMNEVPDDATRTFVRKTGAQWASGKNGIPSNSAIEDWPPTSA